jgi:hypothetical protein
VASQEVIEDRAGRPVTIGEVVLEPVERVTMHVEAIGRTVLTGLAVKAPVALVIRSPAGIWRIELDANADDEDAPDGDG